MASFNAPSGARGLVVPNFRHDDTIAAHKPSRDVLKSGPKRRGKSWMVGSFPSLKMGVLIHHESFLERDKFRLNETEGSILAYGAQPKPIRFTREGKVHTYTPDGFIQYEDRTMEIYEVKPEKIYRQDKDWWDFVTQVYARGGVRFEVYTEVQIRKQPRLQNAERMLLERQHKPTERTRYQVVEAISLHRPATLGDLLVRLGWPKASFGYLLNLALRGHFHIDLHSAPLSLDSRIWAAKRRF